MSANESHQQNGEIGHTSIQLEIRGADGVEDAGLADVWAVGHPLGKLLENNLERTKELQERQDELEAENEQLRERVAILEGRVTPDPTAKDYDEKTRDEKVREVRLSCVQKAKQNGGKGSLEYTDVMTLFNHRPSAGHAYTLLKLGAELDGFVYEQREKANDRLRVTLDAVKDETIFHGVNKASGGASPPQ